MYHTKLQNVFSKLYHFAFPQQYMKILVALPPCHPPHQSRFLSSFPASIIWPCPLPPFPLLLLTSPPSLFIITCVSLYWFIPNSLLTICYCSHLKNRTKKVIKQKQPFSFFLSPYLPLSFFSFSSPPTLFSHNWQRILCNFSSYHVMVRYAYISWNDDHKNASWRISHPQIVTFFGVRWEHLRSTLLANFRYAIQCYNCSHHAVHVSRNLALLDST